jgi:phosphocarrier protein
MWIQRQVVIKNKLGLHVRPATMFAELARRFSSLIYVIKDGVEVDAKSCIDLLTLAAVEGSKLLLKAKGKDARVAVEELTKLVEEGFGEE